MSPLGWFSQTPRLKKRALRYIDPGVVAHFWDGTGQMDHLVKDLSLTGAYLHTLERWYVGSVVVLTLERQAEGTGTSSSISIPCRVARHGPDGVGVKFLLHIEEDRKAVGQFMRAYTEKQQIPEPLAGAVTAETQAQRDLVGQEGATRLHSRAEILKMSRLGFTVE